LAHHIEDRRATAGRPPGDQKAGNGQAAGKQWEAAGRLFEQ